MASFSHLQLNPSEMGGGGSEENVLLACDRAATGLWRIERDERFGRYMVATRDILPGQLILAEEPIVWGPNTTNRNLVCLGCFRLIQLKNALHKLHPFKRTKCWLYQHNSLQNHNKTKLGLTLLHVGPE